MPSLLAPLREAATYRSLAFLGTALVMAPVELGLLIAGPTTVGVLLITPLVVVVLLGLRGGVGLLAQGEAALARELLGVDVRGGRLSSGGTGFWSRGKAVLVDASFWRELGYLVLRVLVGWPLAVAVVSLLASSLWLIGLPIYYRWVHADIGGWHLHTLQQAVLLVPVGVIGLVLSLNLTRVLAAAWGSIAGSLLRAGGGPLADGAVASRRALRVWAIATLVVLAVIVVVWAATGAGTFWPVWPILGSGVPLAAFAWIVYVGSRADWRQRGVAAVASTAGVAVALLFMFLVIWAITGAGYFWPLWPALAFALVVTAHALASRGGPAKLRERIDVLETTRAGAVDLQEGELRRIERDLHDGAQARLVALGMNLGMAEQKFAADPEAARGLVTEARLGVEEALRELRDLARGIHPPVLADRGLEAAISALAHRSAVPVFVTAEVTQRPPAAVESAAYFVAAEALTNAAKHAGASRIEVRIVRDPRTLVVEVTDDGRGGADPGGSGLTGLRHRVEALDGTLAIVSPSGGGTTLRAELPCVS